MGAYSSVATGNWNDPITWAAAWVADTVQTVGSWRRPTVANGYIYECTARAGDFKTGLVEPTWPTTPGNTVVDDQVTWTCRAVLATAGDTATINAGHVVTYNVSSTTLMGAITVHGTFKASRTMSTKLINQYTNGAITVSATGTVDWGKQSDPIPIAYTAEVYRDMTGGADNTVSIFAASAAGASFYLCGDSAAHGNIWKTWLSTGHSAGATSITVPANVAGKWSNGQEIVIHKGMWSNIPTDGGLFTINGTPTWDGVKTTIPITPALGSGTWYQGGMVIHLTRNVKVGKSGATITYGAGNSPRPIPFNMSSMVNQPAAIEVDHCEFIGAAYVFNNLSSGIFRGNAVRHGLGMCNSAYSCEFDGVLVGQPIYSAPYLCISRDAVINSATAGTLLSGGAVDVKLYGSYCGFGQLTSGNIALSRFMSGCRVYANNGSFAFSNIVIEEGAKIGYNEADIAAPNAADVWYPCIIKSKGLWSQEPRNATGTLAGPRYSTPPLERYSVGKQTFVGWDGNPNTHLTYYDYVGRVEPEASILRTGGVGASVKATVLAGISATGGSRDYLVCLDAWKEMAVPAAAQTRSIWMRGFGWTSWPTNAELYLEARYYTGSGVTTATAVSTAVLADNTTWVEFPVTFTPGAVGMVEYRLYLKKYEASSGVYIDHALYRSGTIPLVGMWHEGESMVHADYQYPPHRFNPRLSAVGGMA